jgi:putative tricarboxylic transport membrane protein
MEPLFEALSILLTPASLAFLIGGVSAGILVGATPGLTSTIAIGLLIPFTFTLSKYSAFILLLGIYCGSMYGGSIPAVLMNLPGTPTSAVTAQDGYPMTRSGRPGYALSISVVSSTLGGLFSCVVLVFLSLQLAYLATAFAGPEYFALCLFALAVVFSTATRSILKGIIATGAGMLVATIGIDPVAPYPRFTFGVMEITIGIPEVPATIGLFCVAEGIRLLSDPARAQAIRERVRSRSADILPIVRRLWRTILRSSIIGTVIGILPGAGAMMASFIAYGEAKRVSRTPEEFGQGSAEGIAASESANNAVTGGSLIPMMTLGIPGDVNTLMLLGAMLVHGLIPGPALFRDESSLVYVIFLTIFCANIVILVLGSRFAPFIAKVTQVDQRYLIPVILILAITGPAISAGHIYYFWITIIFGVVGYVMDRAGFPVMAMAMAIVLGPIIERSFRSALMLPQSPLEVFFGRPIALTFILLAIAVIVFGIYRELRLRRAEAAAAATTSS